MFRRDRLSETCIAGRVGSHEKLLTRYKSSKNHEQL